MRKGRRRAPYWNRERVIEGLKRFARRFKCAPTSSEAYHALAKGTGRVGVGAGNPYPSFSTVLRHFTSFRAAWTACGVEMNRSDEPWSADEDWFLGEAAGLLTRIEIAAYLQRTPDAVHRRLYDLGIHSYQARGWTAHRVMMATGVGDYILREYLERGELPYLQGSKCRYLDPADLLVVREIVWTAVSTELVAAVQRSLMARLVALLSGRDWRTASPYKAVVTRTSQKRWREENRRQTLTPPPNDLRVGDQVRLTVTHPDHPGLQRRRGRVFAVYFSRTAQASSALRRGTGPCWVARVEYPRQGAHARLQTTIPLHLIERAGLASADVCTARKEQNA